MTKTKKILLTQLSVLFYSLGSVASKYASNESLFSKSFIIYCSILLFLLVIYSLVWQQVLKNTTLSFAYVNKATSIIWGMLIGYIAFFEKISINNLIGAFIVISGIVIVSLGDKNNE